MNRKLLSFIKCCCSIGVTIRRFGRDCRSKKSGVFPETKLRILTCRNVHDDLGGSILLMNALLNGLLLTTDAVGFLGWSE